MVSAGMLDENCEARNTVVGKVETAIDPYALLRNFNIFLRVNWPLSLGGNPLSLCFGQLFARARAWV